eukprot:GILK01001064.1.p1 GENE.GILK01001064.1~~GILK01001064.1.p1  ORF type:complete len:140 (-),score=20.44 GILK01001064.1:100-471(-)
MADPSQAGIQALLRAEEEASRIVNRARENRTKKLRDAKTEADREIAQFKAQQEDRFQRDVAERWGNQEGSRELEEATQREIGMVRQDYTANKDAVIEMMMKHVLAVRLELPEIVKKSIRTGSL